jgi:hypothetical protein
MQASPSQSLNKTTRSEPPKPLYTGKLTNDSNGIKQPLAGSRPFSITPGQKKILIRQPRSKDAFKSLYGRAIQQASCQVD